MKKVLLTLLFSFLLFLAIPQGVFAACGGSVTCMNSSEECGPGCPTCPGDCGTALTPPCVCDDIEHRWSGSCGDQIGGCQPYCIHPGNTQYIESTNCAETNDCPSGQVFCGDCINGCRSNSQTCNSWISQECGGGGGDPGGGGGGGCPACFSGIANCGVVGRPSGSGSCGAGEICCGDITCNPSCPGGAQCGGSNGCGGTCSSADNGSPPLPTINTPSDGGIALMNPDTGQVRINWSNTNKADRWEYALFPQGVVSCSDPAARCGTVNVSRLDFTPTALTYEFRVRAINIDCGTDYSSWTPYITFTIHAPVTGSVYLDNSNTASLTGSVCSTGASLPTIQAGSSAVGISQNGEDYSAGSVAGDGTFQASAPYWDPGNNILQLNIGDSGLYTCTCPAGCVYSGISSPASGVNFYIIEARDPWFQIQGGPIAALRSSGTAIRNYIPDICTEENGCQPYLILQDSETENSSGYVMKGGGAVDLRLEAGEQTSIVDEDGRNISATVDRKVAEERYEYFVRLYQFPETPQDDFVTSANDAQKPTLAPLNDGVNAYYRNGNLRIEDDWNITAGEEITVFVNGDVTIAGQILTETGGFLGIIASGDITIDPSVEHAALTDTDGLVEGVFVANGQILLPSRGAANGGDGKFVGEGTFVGWNGIVLERDYDDNAGAKVDNNYTPTEVFRYRPDFLINAPDEMKVPRYIWREVAP